MPGHKKEKLMNHIRAIQQMMAEKNFEFLLITDERNQRYACGFPFTDGFVLISAEDAWLITDSRYYEAALETVGCRSEQDIKILLYGAGHPRMKVLKEILDGQRHAGEIRLAVEDSRLSHIEYLNLERLLNIRLMGSENILENLRASKDKAELQSMVRAQRISEHALEETLPLIRPGMTEKEVAAELVYRMLRFGSEGNAFDPIVVTGKNTSKPHGVPGDTVIQAGDFVTMDFGSMKDGYCSDMTRTVAVGCATEEMRSIYDVVLKAQLAGISAARSGIPGSAIDTAARQVIRDAGYGEFFGHGFGHSLGLEIHERPVANPNEKRLMPDGAVCSAEPGIYLPGKFGVRIEDVMILREDGAEVITKAPKNELIIVGNG